MDETTNENASRILRGMLNIGQPSNTDNGQEASSTSCIPDNTRENERLINGFDIRPETGPDTDSFDSFNEQETPRISLDPVHQLVHLTSDEQKGSVVIYGNDVHITTNEMETRRPTSSGSSRVRISPVVNFDWEPKYYNGNLLTVCSKYMSYALKGKDSFVLRIINRKTALRALIKGFTGSIEDVAFAHYNSNVLACTDSAGDIFVWTIYEENDRINYDLKLHVKRTHLKSTSCEGNRLIWCPYINESVDEGQDSVQGDVVEQVLAVTFGNVAEALYISMVKDAHGDTVDIKDVKTGIMRVANGHKERIADIALAPDGSVLATASEDGDLKFWNLDFESNDPPRCLHEMQPHDGKPVSRLIFCDNLLVPDDKSPFWRFLMTGANHSSELKIWCTVTWTCLQTIRFELPASNLCHVSPPPLKLKASLDLSAKYLVLSDINRKILYVFLLHEDLEEGKAHVTSVAHFMLTQPLLSFVITEAKLFKTSVRDSMDQNGEPQQQDDEEEKQETEERVEASEDDVKPVPTIKIKLHCIHTKAMQELTVQYHPFASVPPPTPSSVAALSTTSPETSVLDGLSDVSGLDTSSTEVEEVETRSDASSSNKPKLIAPNAFTTPVPQTSQTPPEAASITSSITSVTSMNNSFGSVNIDELLGKSASSQISESICTFRTCEDETQQEAPSKGAESFSLWTGQGSPIVHPLPESPDPAKVPFPAFKSGGRGDDKELKSERFSAITHSTPKRRHSREDEQEEDSEKTPTAENEPLPKGREVTEEVEIESATDIQRNITNIKEVERSEPPLPSEIGAGTSKEIVPSGLEPADNEPLRDSVRIEATSVDLEQSVPEQGQNLPLSETPKRTDEPLPLKNKMRSNLTVTPRKQVDIPPEAVMQQPVFDSNISSSLDEMLSILRTQQTEINQLRSEIQNQQRQQNQQVTEVLREEVAVLECAVSSKMETVLAEHAREQDQMFDRFAREKQTNEKQKHEKLISSLATSLSNKVEKTVKNEIKNSVNSGLQKATVPLQELLNTTMAQKLTATDAVLKESIQKMVKDKSVVDAIGNAVGSAIQGRLQVSLSEFLSSSMLPGFERACQAMYSQMNAAFEKGTQQYLRSFESYADGQREVQKEQRDPIVQQLQSLVKSFQTASEKLSTSMSGSLLEMMQTQLTSSMKRLQSVLVAQLQDDLTKSLQETIQKEVCNVLQEHSMTNPANHSSPHVQPRRTELHIQQLIDKQEFCEAFQEALTAADLGLVVMVCHASDPVALFGQDPCPLSQPILLSLIQQLSVDLSSDTELKQRYLQEAVAALNTNDPITREHVATIINGLCQQIQTTIPLISGRDPSNSLQRSLKILLMSAKSLLS